MTIVGLIVGVLLLFALVCADVLGLLLIGALGYRQILRAREGVAAETGEIAARLDPIVKIGTITALGNFGLLFVFMFVARGFDPSDPGTMLMGAHAFAVMAPLLFLGGQIVVSALLHAHERFGELSHTARQVHQGLAIGWLAAIALFLTIGIGAAVVRYAQAPSRARTSLRAGKNVPIPVPERPSVPVDDELER